LIFPQRGQSKPLLGEVIAAPGATDKGGDAIAHHLKADARPEIAGRRTRFIETINSSCGIVLTFRTTQRIQQNSDASQLGNPHTSTFAQYQTAWDYLHVLDFQLLRVSGE